MSDPKLVSPLLDGFVMGDPMSSHDGVRCCPAMRENSDEKYIVKIISVPASQRQLDALLLTGAYKDAADAAAYFKDLADGVVKEAQLLQQLSKLEGFLPYEGWQVVPMENNDLGYDIYLVSSYKRSLEKHLRRTTMTQLGAVNLGLDLCAALSICRRSGHMYVDLKPGNIFLTGEREYRIGDLGFVKLNSLKYTSMPSKYCSRYTPPELHDALATLNPTVDVYAVGLILYQIYNNGNLPFEDKAPKKILPAPMNADYEMAEIILKACHPNPRNRYQTPIEMGQALVAYMQRNTVNDVPIVPPAAEPPITETPAPSAEAPEEEAPAAETPETAAHEELAFLEDMVSDETAPGAENGDDQADAAVTEEGNDLLAQADELISHEAPSLESVQEEAEETEPAEEVNADELDLQSLINNARSYDSPYGEDDEEEDEDDDFIERPHKKKSHGWLTTIIVLLILALLVGGGYYYYRNYYQLNIDYMDIQVDRNTLTIQLTTDVDESLLSVVCTDTYGNVKTMPVTDGQAVFTDLNANTQYDIKVQVAGFHQLTGAYFGTSSTQKQTNIVDFTAKTGTEDGSVILNFTVDGPETQDWVVEYSTEGEETQSVSFTGHMVTITGLSVGKTYTFSLVSPPSAELYLAGSCTLEFTASRIIVAENVTITSCGDGSLTAQWNANADATVASWTVRCYSDNGYDQTITVTDTTATFTDIVDHTAYTVEVCAAGMTQSTRAFVTANPATITSFTAAPAEDDPCTLNVSWEFEGTAPEGGWLLMYSVDGRDSQQVIPCDGTSAVIENCVPGAVYDLTLQASDGSTVFGGTKQYTCSEAEEFNDHSLKASSISGSMCPTPDVEGWTYKDVADEDYTTKFTADAKASLVLYSSEKMSYPSEDTQVMYVIRNSQGQVMVELVRTETANWKTIWKNRYCSLDIPAMPTEVGEYTIEIYFNGAFAISKTFSIVE